MFDAGDSANLDFRRAFQAATQFLRDIGKSHGKAPELLVRLTARLAQGKEGSTAGPWSLLVEKARLRRCGRSSGGLPARDAHDTKNGHFRERGTRDKDTVRGRVQVRRRNLQPVIEERQQIVWHNAFQGLPIVVTQLYPQTVEFGPAQKGFALGLEVVRKFTH